MIKYAVRGERSFVLPHIVFATTARNFSLLGSATSYLASVRLKVASTLASTLSISERQNLFENLNIDLSKEVVESGVKASDLDSTNVPVTNSIGEVAAVAIAKESVSQLPSLEKEKEIEKIWKTAEKATMERMANDILLKERKMKLDRWKIDLEREKNEAGKTSEIIEEEHPILGPTILDLGYKRIHVTSAKNLLAIPIWEKQRTYRHDRAKAMATDKIKTFQLGIPGVISLYESEGGDLAILDGQHRIGMFSILKQKGADINLDRILVEVFPQLLNHENHALDIFTEINKAEPVKVIDMPGIAKQSERRIINEAATVLAEKYPSMFKPSQRCRSPHLNIDNLRDAVFASGLLKRHSITNQKALVSLLISRNEELADLYKNDIYGGTRPNGITSKALKKAKTNDFFLGLDSSWLYK